MYQDKENLALHNNSNAPPPFLTKTYDMIDDATTDSIVSWSDCNNSFVVWNPPEFSQYLLPKYFKHNNFSSFVRQLNTYGFRKVDPDRWEFANEGFLRGRRELLRGIHRRKPAAQSQQQQAADGGLGPCVEVGKAELKKEIEMLKKDKNVLMLELVRLQHEQQNTDHELQVMGERLQATEHRQQQIMAFLAKAVQTPGFLAHLAVQSGNNTWMAASARKKRRLEKGEIEGEVEDSFDPAATTDGQIIALQTNGEVVHRIMQLLSPSDAYPTINEGYLYPLISDHDSAPVSSEGNTLNQQSGITFMDPSTGLAEHVHSDPVVTDPKKNEDIVQLHPTSPTSDVARAAGDDHTEQGSGSSQSWTRDTRDSNIDSGGGNGRGPSVSTEVEEVSSSINDPAVVSGANDVFWEQYLRGEPETPPTAWDTEPNHPQETENRTWEYAKASVGIYRDDGRVPQARNWWDSKPPLRVLSHQMGQVAPG
ncbi:unnamed protein product [Sphagnum jensenii]|uniref:HSF-type DNA-binding domain-containing protein n=1 Tax=Sphagnum jensenii TaxID=128206 RepID=A0ABP1BPS3_9BRYO